MADPEHLPRPGRTAAADRAGRADPAASAGHPEAGERQVGERQAATAQRRALRHVEGLSAGGPMDPRLRVTLNFHPHRATATAPS